MRPARAKLKVKPRENWATICRYCGYDNWGIPGNICPECGERFMARPRPPATGTWDARSLIKASLVDLPGLAAVNIALAAVGLVGVARVGPPPGALLMIEGGVLVSAMVVGGVKAWVWVFPGRHDVALVDIERFVLKVLIGLTLLHLVMLLVYLAG